MNLKSGITANIDWAEYLDGIYANATTHDLLNDTTSTPAQPPTRQVYYGEIFHDASSEYDVHDDDSADNDYEQVFNPTIENGVTVMKARFQKRDGNRNRRPPRSPRTMIPRDKFPNEGLQRAWMQTSQ